MSTSATTPITFNGSSTYSSSFQQVITRAVAIASLPLQILQQTVSTLQSQQSALTSLGSNFTSLQNAIQALGTAATGTAIAQVSNPSALSAATTVGALSGTYTIQVDDPGSSTTTLSINGLTTVSDPTSQDISASASLQLSVNGVNTTIDNSGGTLDSLVSGINAANAGVQATIVNVGGASSPDYRLALTSTNLGADTIQLSDGSTPLLQTLAPGTDAQYKVNGSQTDTQSTSTQIALSPGLTINLIAQSSSPVTITVSHSLSGVQSAISNVVSAYNAAYDALNQNRGQGTGALNGDPLVLTLSNILQQITQYSSGGSGSVNSLADLGITVSATGELAFDATSMSNDQAAIGQFLGGLSSGGFLQTASNELTAVTDTGSGMIASDFNALAGTITTDNTQIADKQNQIATLQTNLQNQLAQADAAIATLQAQNTYFQQLFTAEYGGTAGTNGTNGA
ncbi:MAG TPA: flagellar filament capping protein FliD [Bryobacteraceae bacterium]|jgi:flagellar hook-associated protein 2